jgi:hypothetical protein
MIVEIIPENPRFWAIAIRVIESVLKNFPVHYERGAKD